MRGRRGGGHVEDMGEEAEASGELNLVPYLDIITALVIFLVFTFQVIIEFKLIELVAPAYSASAKQANQDPEKPTLQLNLAIHSQGYTVTADDDVGILQVPMIGNEYDTKKLSMELDRLKRAVNASDSLIVLAEDNIEYRHVVAAIDAAREYEDRILFPNVMLSKRAK